jgi:hypothetical protein
VALFSYKPKLVVLEEAAAQVPSPRKKLEELGVPEPKRATATVPEEMFDPFKVVKDAPEPENKVAVTVPVEGLNVNLVDDTFCGKFPVVVVTQVGYIVALVVVSLVMPVLVALVAFVADVALVALVALPLKVAVIVPALKLPEASRATTLEAVFKFVASTAKVRAVEPLNVPALVKYVPAVSAAAVALAVVAVVAVVALPDKEAVIVPAEKLPEPSRATTLETVLVEVASTAKVLAVEPSNVPPLVKYVPAVSAAVVLAVIVMFAEPLKLTPLMLRAVCRVVAVVALPLKAAVTVPALKLPEASRATIAFAVLAEVAVVAALGMVVEAVIAPVPLPNT